MIRSAIDAIAAAAIAAVLAAVIGFPVLQSPSTRVFGAPVVGRHHDPFTVMWQFEQPVHLGIYAQPVTDDVGALIARTTGGVAAYNWIVLLSFPLAAAAAFLLARHLDLSRGAALFAALAFAFSPFHVAQAAYHPQVAQVEWIPLYLLALWCALDRPSAASLAGLVLATAGVALSNFYGGLIAAVVTPVAVASYWWTRDRGKPDGSRRLIVTSLTLTGMAAAGLAYVWKVAPAVLRDPAGLRFDRANLFVYCAKWWSYLIPPVVNPWVGRLARDVWTSAGVHDGLLEQQVTLGAGVILLGLVAIGGWLAHRRRSGDAWAVPTLTAVAAIALVCSLSPERTIAGFRIVRPSAWLYAIAPMFRAYARFGVVVQLMAALLAGIGLDRLIRRRRIGSSAAAVACVILVAAEYAVVPAMAWRDVLPTRAHRWLIERGGPGRAIDCTPVDSASQSLVWLTQNRIAVLGDGVDDCDEPELAKKLAALGYADVIVPAGSAAPSWAASPAPPEGLRRVAAFADGQVFAVSAAVPALYTGWVSGFFPRESDGQRSWRWMSAQGSWYVVNTRARAVEATLWVGLQAFGAPRHVEILVDRNVVETLTVASEGGTYDTAPLIVPPGGHLLTFRAVERPTVADIVVHNGDTRALSVAVGDWTWEVRATR